MTTETGLTAKEAAEKAQRYHALKTARYLLPGGEVLTINDYKKETEKLHAELESYIEGAGEPLMVEGLPPLRVKGRSSGWSWDVKSMAEAEPAEYARLLDSNALTVNKKVADALKASGLLSVYERFGFEGSTNVLAFDKEKP